MSNVELAPSAAACPLAPDWPARLRPLTFRFADPDQEAFLRAAHQADLGKQLTVIDAQWQVAADDLSHAPSSPEAHRFAGYPCHIHTEFVVDGQRVHLDRTWANLREPGRLKVEWHIFVDGVLAGFGGELGCSLGFTRATRSGPAVALLNLARAIVLRPRPRRGIELNEVLAEPDEIALVAVKAGRR